MKQIAQEDFKQKLQSYDLIGHIGEDFYIYEVVGLQPTDHPFKTSMHICCIHLCGEAEGKINLIPYRLKAPAITIVTPGQILESESISSDFRGICIAMSNNFVSELGLPYNFNVYMSVQDNPVISLTDKQHEALMNYCTMIRRLIEINHPNRMEVIKHLACAFFYGFGYYFHQVSETKILSNDEVLMQTFLNEVRQFYKRERKVLYYADKLHLSAGYLSTIIKKVSGKTAAGWIDEHVALEAKTLLKNTNMTVQQISDELNFPTQSFFGKFFKRLIGVSPKEYREKRLQENGLSSRILQP